MASKVNQNILRQTALSMGNVRPASSIQPSIRKPDSKLSMEKAINARRLMIRTKSVEGDKA